MSETGLNFTFTEEQEMIRQMVKEFVDREVRPKAAEIDQKGQIPPEIINKAKELGLFGMSMPEEYGGAGAGEIGYCIQMEELAHGCNSLATFIGAHSSICMETIYLAGSEALKKRFLPKLCSAETIGCYALTEPSGGSDAAMLRMTADKKGDKYVLNGQKIWITNADAADIFIVFALTDKSLRAHGGITAFVVEKSQAGPGLKVGTVDKKMGLRGAHSPEVWLENVEVPEENIIGKVGEGFKYAMMALDRGRLSLGAGCTGAAKEVTNLSIGYAKKREAFGKPIAEHQLIQGYLAEMAGKIYAMESMVYRTAWMCDAGKRFSRESAIVKMMCSESGAWIIDRALQIHGGMGYMCELPLERYYRDERVNRIFEGTSEIQRLVIARDLLKRERY